MFNLIQMNEERKKRIQQRKEKEKEQRRNEIITKAMDLFISKGYDNTSMEDIALEASLSKGTLYNYFDSKDDLYLAVSTIAIRKLNDFYESFERSSKSNFKQIISLGYATYEFSKKYPNLFRIASDIRAKPYYLNIQKKGLEGLTLNLNETEMNNETQRYRDLIFNPIKEAIDNKIIRDDLPPILLILTITSLTGGIIDVLSNFKQPFHDFYGVDPDKIMELVFEWVSEGIKPKTKK